MLTELCQEIRNWFERAKYFGEFTVEGGELSVDFLQDGQYFRIIGSLFNDGVHKYPASDLTDEVFEGAIWSMAVPPSVVALAEEIEDWQAKYGDTIAKPYQSESFGGYSYTMKTSGTDGGNTASSWQGAFASKLSKWRKL